MIYLDRTTRSLQANVGQNSTSALPVFTVCYRDQTPKDTLSKGVTQITQMTVSSLTTICDAPSQAYVRQVERITGHGADTVSTTVSVFLTDATSTRVQWKGVLQTLETVYYSSEKDWHVMTSSGAIK